MHSDRLTERGRFRYPDCARNHIPADGITEVRANLLHDMIGQPRPRVVHSQDHGRDLKLGVQVASHELDIPEQLAKTFQGVVLALNRHKHLTRRCKGIDRDQPERGWAVDQHVAEVLPDRSEHSFQSKLSAEDRNELDLRSGQVDCRRCQEQVLDARRFDTILESNVTKKNVVHRVVEVPAPRSRAR